MSEPALDMRAWREVGIKAFGFAACAAVFPTPPANDSPSPPVQREMPFLGAVEPAAPRLSREDTAKARRRILNDPAVTRAGKAVARALFAHQWYGKTDCWPGYERLAEVSGISERTVARGIANLIECEHVQRRRRGRVGHPKGGRRSNSYSLQLEFDFGRKPPNPAKRLADKGGEVSATVRTKDIESGGRDNRNTSPSQTLPTEQSESKAQSTPVRHGGGSGPTGPSCPRCGMTLTIQRDPEGVSTFCLSCGHDGGFMPSQLFARVGNCQADVAYKQGKRIRSKRGRDYARRTRGDPYADRRSG